MIAAETSLELLSLSLHPLFFLIAAVLLFKVIVGEVSEQVAVVGLMPYPMKSTMDGSVGQLPAVPPFRTFALATRAIFPAVEPTRIPPVKSGAGLVVVPPAPWDS